MNGQGEHKILLASVRGFCAGVERALQIVESALQAGPFPVYVLHEIVHNELVVQSLRERGVIFIDEVEQASGQGTLIFSAHGVSRKVEESARRTDLTIVDATCPIVKKLHRNMEEYASQKRHILLFGKKGHREVEGLLGRVDSPVTVLESPAEVEEFLQKADRHLPYGCLSQTTLNAQDVAEMSSRLQQELSDLQISANVCFATRDRQNAVRLLAKECSVILVVGSGKSSNTRRLLETARSCGVDSYLVPSADALKEEWIQPHKVIGITSGASAPESLLESVRLRVEELCGRTAANLR